MPPYAPLDGPHPVLGRVVKLETGKALSVLALVVLFVVLFYYCYCCLFMVEYVYSLSVALCCLCCFETGKAAAPPHTRTRLCACMKTCCKTQVFIGWSNNQFNNQHFRTSLETK